MEITYELLKPIIKSEVLNGQHMDVTFQAEGQQNPIQAKGMMVPDQSQIVKNATKGAVKQGIVSSIISSLSRLLGGAIGGAGGSIASSAASTAAHTIAANQMNSQQDMLKVPDTPENRQKAVLMAFQSVKMFFEWDPASSSWKGKDPAAAQAAQTNIQEN